MDNIITFTNEDGTLKDKDEVIENISKLYDTIAEEENKNMLTASGEEYFAMIANSEKHINLESLYETDNFYQRIIYINQEIDDVIAQKIHQTIRFYNDIDAETPVEDRVPIQIYINTDGGDLDAARCIISAILVSDTPIYTWNIGKAFSAGFFILISGHKRFGMPQSSYLLHEGSSAIYADAHKFFQYTEHYKQLLEELRTLTLDHTKITGSYYDSQKPNDVWFMADKALELGVIDMVADFI